MEQSVWQDVYGASTTYGTVCTKWWMWQDVYLYGASTTYQYGAMCTKGWWILFFPRKREAHVETREGKGSSSLHFGHGGTTEQRARSNVRSSSSLA
jgi:hypothetical protein